MESNIVLIGFMGSGKTTIGKELSKELKMEFIDTDQMIEKDAGITIKEMFEKHGEKYFRDLETETAKSTAGLQDKIISTGGGIILRKENVEFLKKNGFIVLLDAKAQTIYERVKHKTDRPLLNVPNPVEKINELLAQRGELYKGAADYIVTTDGRDVFEIVTEIKEKYLRR